MSIPYKIIGVLALVLGLLGGVWGYGHSRYNAGFHERDVLAQQEAAQILAQSRTKELAAQAAMEKAQHDAYLQQQVADAAVASAHTESERLRDEIARQRARANIARSTAANAASASRAWQLFDECRIRYENVARDADGYVERLRIAQGWAKVIQNTK